MKQVFNFLFNAKEEIGKTAYTLFSFSFLIFWLCQTNTLHYTLHFPSFLRYMLSVVELALLVAFFIIQIKRLRYFDIMGISVIPFLLPAIIYALPFPLFFKSLGLISSAYGFSPNYFLYLQLIMTYILFSQRVLTDYKTYQPSKYTSAVAMGVSLSCIILQYLIFESALFGNINFQILGLVEFFFCAVILLFLFVKSVSEKLSLFSKFLVLFLGYISFVFSLLLIMTNIMLAGSIAFGCLMLLVCHRDTRLIRFLIVLAVLAPFVFNIFL